MTIWIGKYTFCLLCICAFHLGIISVPLKMSETGKVLLSSGEGGSTVQIESLGTRARSLSEKGLEWQTEERSRRFKSAMTAWRRQAGNVEETLVETSEISIIREESKLLKERMLEVTATYEQVQELTPPSGNQQETSKYESVDEENHQLIKKISSRIREIEIDRTEIMSNASARSFRSWHSSQGSQISNLSSATMKIEAATEVAALEIDLKYMDEEAEQRKMQTAKKLDQAKAKLNVIKQVMAEEGGNFDINVGPSLPGDGMNEYVENYIQTQSCDAPPTFDTPLLTPAAAVDMNDNRARVPQVRLNPKVEEYRPRSVPAEMPREQGTHGTWTYSQETPGIIPESHSTPHNGYRPLNTPMRMESNMYDTSQHVLELTRAFAEQVSINRLPAPEPTVFSGDPMRYPSWKGAFQTLIDQRGIPPLERIYYLKRYLGGAALEAVEGFCLLTTADAYEQARNLLDERFGDPFIVANAFRDKLDAWPDIAPRDGSALRKFADFLRQCNTAMQTTESLNILNDSRENRKLLCKLPDWLVTRWSRIAAEWTQKMRLFPPFKEFMNFVVKEADIACNPITSLQALRGNRSNEPANNAKYGQRKEINARSLATEVKEAPQESDNSGQVRCVACDMPHELNDCQKFLAKPLAQRKNFAWINDLCFGCLKPGHQSKDCNDRKKCATCKRRHPTSLHDDNWKPLQIQRNKMAENDAPKPVAKDETELKVVNGTCNQSRITHFNGSGNSGKSSMIVPVYLSHQDRPESEVLVYALLDTQSDTTFIHDDICDELGLEGSKTKLLLSTMFAENKAIESKCLTGLQVRGHDSQEIVPLPTTYTRNIIPANRSHIPTPEMADKWSHLKPIVNKLMPLGSCKVGLLIGYNCPRALAPKDVILPTGNEPYAQRTDLGWSIVGIVDSSAIEFDECDQFGVSHRIIAQEIPSALWTRTEDNETQDTPEKVLFAFKSKVKELCTPKEVIQMMELDFIERKADQDTLSQDDRMFLSKIKEGIHIRDDGHYEMPLPFKGPDPAFLSNKTMALQRLKQVKYRLRKDTKYRKDYSTFMSNVNQAGYAERVPLSELERKDGTAWCIPHHGVNHSKKPNKIQTVFDCSAEFKGESLNDHLLKGPDLTNTSIGVLSRFCQERVAFMCDDEQTFHQFKVNEEHHDCPRALWWENADYERNPKEYLRDLQVRPKWTRHRRDLKEGDIVIVKDENTSRNQWQLARVHETYPSEDGHVRKVKLAMESRSLNAKGKQTCPTMYLDRPIQKLVLLVEGLEDKGIPDKEP